MDEYKYTVCTLCTTYNHVPYIEEALHGFCIQETSFPVVYVIIDDASIDGEPELLKKWASENLFLTEEGRAYNRSFEYGQEIFARHKKYTNLFFTIILLRENHHSQKKTKRPYFKEWFEQSKYRATCEGDDYWTDSLKLQKQVDFLESNPQYSFCVHNFKKFIEKDKQFVDGYRYKEDFSFGVKDYLKYWPTQPLTSLVRVSAIPSEEIQKKFKYYRDNHIFYLYLQNGLGYYMADVLGVYRVSNKGIWTSLNQVSQIEIDLKCYLELYQYNKVDKDLKKKCINQYVLYFQTCKENNVPVKKEVKDLMWRGGRFKANAIILYSRLRRLIK